MKRVLLGATAALVAGSAFAAEMPLKAPPPPPPVWVWTGIYAGVNVGVHWGEDRISYAADPLGWDASPFPSTTAAAIDAISSVTLKTRGLIGGVQVGYNWQTTNIVWGFEADGDEASGHGFRSLTYPVSLPNAGDITTNSSTERWLATVRARLGVTGWGATDNPNQYLFYVTGG